MNIYKCKKDPLKLKRRHMHKSLVMRRTNYTPSDPYQVLKLGKHNLGWAETLHITPCHYSVHNLIACRMTFGNSDSKWGTLSVHIVGEEFWPALLHNIASVQWGHLFMCSSLKFVPQHFWTLTGPLQHILFSPAFLATMFWIIVLFHDHIWAKL